MCAQTTSSNEMVAHHQVHSREEFATFCQQWNGKAHLRVKFNEFSPDEPRRLITTVRAVTNVVIDIDSLEGHWTPRTIYVAAKIREWITEETGRFPICQFSGKKGVHMILPVEQREIKDAPEAQRLHDQINRFLRTIDRLFGTKKTKIDPSGLNFWVSIPYTIHPQSGKEVLPLDYDLEDHFRPLFPKGEYWDLIQRYAAPEKTPEELRQVRYSRAELRPCIQALIEKLPTDHDWEVCTILGKSAFTRQPRI